MPWWALAGDQPFGLCGDIEISGFAICRYDTGSPYRFSCDRNCETVNDAPVRRRGPSQGRHPSELRRLGTPHPMA